MQASLPNIAMCMKKSPKSSLLLVKIQYASVASLPPLIVFAHVYYSLLVLLRVTVLMSLLYYHVTMHFWETLTSGAGLMTHCAGGDRLAGRLGPLPTPPCARSLT